MLGRVFRWVVWLLVLWFALSFVPVILRMNRDQLATLGVFVLCAATFMIVGRIFYSDGRRYSDDEEESLRFMQQRQRAEMDAQHRGQGDW